MDLTKLAVAHFCQLFEREMNERERVAKRKEREMVR